MQEKCPHVDAKYELKYPKHNFGSCYSQYLEKTTVELCKCMEKCHSNILCMGFSFQKQKGKKPICGLHAQIDLVIENHFPKMQCFVDRDLILYLIFIFVLNSKKQTRILFSLLPKASFFGKLQRHFLVL